MTAAAPPQPPTGPAIVFVDERHGFAAGAGGIVATRDGGRRWRLEFRGRVQALDAADATHAWAIGGPTLLRTTDGVHWRVVSHPGLVAVDFVGRRRGYGLDQRGRLETSANGGASWSRIRAPQAQALCATTKGLWLADGSHVWKRQSKGWKRRRFAFAHTPSFPGVVLECRGSAEWAMFFGGGAAGSEGYEVYRTLDAGSHWRRVLANFEVNVPRIDAYPGPFSVPTERTAVFVGVCPACLQLESVVSTRDGGMHWTRHLGPKLFTPEAVSFVDAAHGWLLTTASRNPGRCGRIWKTTDGGRHWRLILRSRALTVGPP